jgi:hypothetical protein
MITRSEVSLGRGLGSSRRVIITLPTVPPADCCRRVFHIRKETGLGSAPV